jgi:hypothetical protein
MFNQNNSRWTEDLIAQMRVLVVDKGLSATRVGMEMHISRNAIIGKCTRLGIKMGDGPRKNSAAYDLRPELREISRATLHKTLGRSGPVRSAAPKRSRLDVAIRNKAPRPSLVKAEVSYGWTAETADSRPGALWEIPHNGCRWPLYAVASAEPCDNLFCGAVAAGPYCPAHHRAAVRV